MSGYLRNSNLQVKKFDSPATVEQSVENNEGTMFPPPSPPTMTPVVEETKESPTVVEFPPAVNSAVEEPVHVVEEPTAVPAPIVAPAEVKATTTVEPCVPGFTMVDSDCKLFAKEYTPKMESPSYIGDTDMLLTYMFREERRHRVTMPIKALGIDPITFTDVEHLTDDGSDAPTNYFTIPGGEGDSKDHVYEVIEVDGSLYLSCMSECLDENYLHRIITEATTTMRETGAYIFRMVGLRRLEVSDGETGRLLETLRLNTYEMSTLCTYMGDFGVEPTFEMIDGHRCICFRTGR